MTIARVTASAWLLLLATAVPARSQDLAGTAYFFSGSAGEGKREKLDHHNVTRGRGRPLKGSSCCEYFVVAFPTDDTFSLRHGVFEIATGSVQARRGRLVLVPDGPSRDGLLWWLENQLESFWNAGVFDLGLNLRLTQLVGQSMVVKLKTVGDDTRGTFRLALSYRGELRDFDRRRVGRLFTGPVRGRATYDEVGAGTYPIADLDDGDGPYPLPPIRQCGDEDAFGDGFDAGVPAAWPGPDYCRE